MNLKRNLCILGACITPGFAAMMEGVTFIYSNNKSIMYAPDQTTILKQWNGGGYAAHFSDSGTVFYESGSSSVSGCSGVVPYGNIVEARWDGTVIRTITASQMGGGEFHHAFTITPKGTILAIARENYNSACGEKIVEYDPNQGKVLWVWHTNDHKGASNAAKLPNKSGNDPYHVNGVDLDPITNRIVFSAHNTYEIYVVDHSIDSTTAKSSSGDILFRWGNPTNYGISGAQSYISTAVHSARYVDPGYPGQGNIVLFANQSPAQTSSYATGYEIHPVMNGSSFVKRANGEFDFEIVFAGVGNGKTTNTGGMDKLPNGNWLVTYTGLNTAAEYSWGTAKQTYAVAAKTWSASSQNGIRRYPLCHSGLAKIAQSDANVAAIYKSAACDAFPDETAAANGVGSGTSSSVSLSSVGLASSSSIVVVIPSSSSESVTTTSSSSSSSNGDPTAIMQKNQLKGISFVFQNGEIRVNGLTGVSEVRLLDLLGNPVYTTNTFADQLRIFTSDMRKGNYILQVKQGGRSWTNSVNLKK